MTVFHLIADQPPHDFNLLKIYPGFTFYELVRPFNTDVCFWKGQLLRHLNEINHLHMSYLFSLKLAVYVES